MQESNAFSSVLTTRADFERTHLLAGQALLQACQPGQWEVKGFLKNLELSGFLKALQAYPELEAVPLLSAWAISGGPLEQGFFEALVAEFCQRLQALGPVDGVFLALHGAMGAQGYDDPEALLLERVREVVGAVPIAVSFDLHANLTRRKLQQIDILCAYQTNPHYDMARTGFKAGQLLARHLLQGLPLSRAWRSLPLLLAGGNTLSMLPPMRRLFQRIKAMERDPRVLAVNLLMCHPYLEHPELGWAVEVLTAGEPELAEQLADELAQSCWELRFQQPPDFLSVEQMLQKVRAARLWRRWGAVAVCDTSDVVGAGGSGENTHLLQALLQATDLRSLYPLRDPQAVTELWEQPVGAALSLQVGGRLQPEVNPPLQVRGRLLAKKQTENFGKVVALDLGPVQLVLTEGYAMPMKPDFYQDLGLKVRQADIVVTKNFFHFRLYYLLHSPYSLYVKTQGITDFERIFQVPTPYLAWPKDQFDNWREVEAQKRQQALQPMRSRASLSRQGSRLWLWGLLLLAAAGHLWYHKGLLPRRWWARHQVKPQARQGARKASRP